MHPFGESTIRILLLSLAVVCQALSGLPLLFYRGSTAAQKLAAGLMALGSLAGVSGALTVLCFPATLTYQLMLGLPFGPFEVGIDPLSAIFLLPVFIVTGCSAVYSVGYWPAASNPKNVGKLTFFLGFLAAALSTLLMARNTILFLIAWEIMAFAAYFTLTTDDDNPEVRDAGTLYLITTHVGTLALFAMFSLLKGEVGNYLFPGQGALPAQSAVATAIFVTALIGFGLKAGVMPLHVWLPSAHANAPSHISAVLSGVVLKTGIYGLVRVFSCFSELPAWWGCTVLVLGGISGVVGVAFAIGQHDLKRLLAYHSIENIGIILLGVGAALIGQSQGVPVLVVLGMGGALLHVVNHATFKALLFLAAGSVIHATGTREIDLMGGVGRRLPYSSLFFLIGAVAICGLPPLNGFVSELMVYLGLFSSIRRFHDLAGALPALAAPALALIGGLAVACFVKVFGVVFLGAPRSQEHVAGHEAPRAMLWPMAILAAVCAVIGIMPLLISSPLTGAVVGYSNALADEPLSGLVPFGWISALAAALVATGWLLWLYFSARTRSLPHAESVTWGCGYLRPTPRMQYSSSSFAAMLVNMFRMLLMPEVHKKEVTGTFPGQSSFQSHVPETVLERGYLPWLDYLYLKTSPIRHLQHGKLNVYIFYTFITLVVLMALTTR
ncbi:proton-conducting transporter membrane subunit [Geomonas sp.]|uniref:proton-conducting transporter transmembrane domain-containing protein n=1 Tax=Geomonas sp. TaxID=2651584 RepID=UPI002B4762FC|nr:proton-conducting transporter membrane subunit [Geomonas sp.]HJV37056.1 proton-conducting transporter membrane subunit [Geomonas sp.]